MSCECVIFAGQGLSEVFYCFWKWSLEQVHMCYESVLVWSGCFLAGFPTNKGVPGPEQIVELPCVGSWKVQRSWELHVEHIAQCASEAHHQESHVCSVQTDTLLALHN